MNFFQISALFSTILIQINWNYSPVVCDLTENVELPQTGDYFWDWVWGSDDNDTEEHKPLDHIKEELEYHYGNIFPDFDEFRLKQEIDFHLFNLHDFDKNKLLDGLEMLSMLNRHDTGGHIHHNTHSFQQNIAVIDLVLRTDDKNNDGFLDYNEFKNAKTKHNLKGL